MKMKESSTAAERFTTEVKLPSPAEKTYELEENYNDSIKLSEYFHNHKLWRGKRENLFEDFPIHEFTLSEQHLSVRLYGQQMKKFMPGDVFEIDETIFIVSDSEESCSHGQWGTRVRLSRLSFHGGNLLEKRLDFFENAGSIMQSLKGALSCKRPRRKMHRRGEW